MPATTRALDADVDAVIGENVHTLIWRRRRRQVEAASALGVTSSVLSKKLRGESAWSARQVHAVARWLQVPVGDLYRAQPDDGATQGHPSEAMLPRLDSNQQPFDYSHLSAA